MANTVKALNWRNRIVGQGSKPASQFLANPLNPRRHPPNQRAAVKGSLDELGWVQNVIENVRTGNLVDGHERVWQALQNADADVPYIQVDLSEEEERLALTILDPISALAGTDRDALDALLREVNTGNEALQTLLADLAKETEPYFDSLPEAADVQAQNLPSSWGVIVECENEFQQVQLLDRLTKEGLTCRALIS